MRRNGGTQTPGVSTLLLPQILLVCLSGCSAKIDTYEVGRETVEYVQGGELVSRTRTLLKGPDLNSFEIMNDSRYATDKHRAYFKGAWLPKSNPASFTLLEFPYSTDGEKVFCGNVPLLNVHAPTFQVLRGSDTGETTRTGDGLDQMFGDLSKQIVLGETNWVYFGWARDKDSIFFGPTRIDAADPKTFRVAGETTGFDAKASFKHVNRSPKR